MAACRLDAQRPHVVGENLAQLVVGDLPDERHAPAQCRDPGHRVGRRPTADLARRTHCRIERVGLFGIEQLHRPLGQIVQIEKRIVARRDDVDDGIADGYDIEARGSHRRPTSRDAWRRSTNWQYSLAAPTKAVTPPAMTVEFRTSPAVPRSLFVFATLYGGMTVLAGVLGAKQVALGPLAVEAGIFAFLLLVALSSAVADSTAAPPPTNSCASASSPSSPRLC